MLKIFSSSKLLGFEKQGKKRSKCTSPNLHSLRNFSCHLLLCSSDYFSIFFFLWYSAFSGASLKDFPDKEQGNGYKKLITGDGLRTRVCASCNPPRKPFSRLLAVNLSEIFFPQTKRCFNDPGVWGQSQGGSGTLARAHPEPSHLGHPASGQLHTAHRRARRYRSTGCDRMSLVAGKGKRRSESVRLETLPIRGIRSQSLRSGQTWRPLPPQDHSCPSPW